MVVVMRLDPKQGNCRDESHEEGWEDEEGEKCPHRPHSNSQTTEERREMDMRMEQQH